MIKVPAPEGIEATRSWNEGAHGWMISFRCVGDKWWTNLGTVGHAHLTNEEITQRAIARLLCPRLGYVAYKKNRG